MYNIGENDLNIKIGINNNFGFYFSDFINIFNEKITEIFINKIIKIFEFGEVKSKYIMK